MPKADIRPPLSRWWWWVAGRLQVAAACGHYTVNYSLWHCSSAAQIELYCTCFLPAKTTTTKGDTNFGNFGEPNGAQQARKSQRVKEKKRLIR